MRQLIKNWLRHVGSFPIMMGIGTTPFQVRVETKANFLNQLLGNLDKDIYVSVHNAEKRQANLYNKIYFDIDNEADLQTALTEAKILCNWLEGKKYNPRVYFTGCKGFAIYLDFPEIEIKDYRDRVEAFMDLTEYTLGITTFDRGVCGDKNRISRLPHTINTKTGKMCVPIRVREFDFATKQPHQEIKILPTEFGEKFIAMPYKKKANYQPPQTHGDIATTLDYILKHASDIKDGAQNLIWIIIIPSMAMQGATDGKIISTCEKFVSKNYVNLNYKSKAYIRAQLRSYRNRTKNKFIYPMRLDTFRGRFDLVGI